MALTKFRHFARLFAPPTGSAITVTAEAPKGFSNDSAAQQAVAAAGRAGGRSRAATTPRDGHFYSAIISQLRSAPRLFAWLGASTGFYALGHGATALAAGLLGRALVRHGGGAELADPWRAAVCSILCFGVLAAIIKSISGVLLAYYEAKLAGRVGRELRGRAVAGLLNHGTYDAPPRVLATIAVRIREVETATSAGAVLFVRAVAQLVPLALALIFVSPLLAIAGTLALLPFALLVARFRTKWRWANAHSQALVEELHGNVDDLVRNVDLWRSYGAGSRIAGAIDETSGRAVSAAARVDGARAALSGANEVLGAVALLGAVGLALGLGIPLGDGTLIAFAAVFFMAYRPLRDLGDARAWCCRGSVAMDALAQLIGAAAPVQDEVADRASTANSIVHHDSTVVARLSVEAVGARERGPVTSFVVRPGELVVVVGPTGSGKTTLLRTLLGLDAAVGRLLYGGSDLTHVAVGPAARPFAWVPQDAPLVTGTLLGNVALHAPDEDAAARALKQIGAERLLQLRDQIVGPGGRALSGGERRQVAIARALASGQPVLLLDEPTSGLDEGSARHVLDALSRLRGQRSMVVVTHRKEVTAIADRVVRIGAEADRATPLPSQLVA